ncbi:MAG: WD40/YVTN/BNR-like repeat-containing protein [Thermoplasmata archaeon]
MVEVRQGDTIVSVGTRKGLFLFHSRDRKRWHARGPFFEGDDVMHAILDPRDGESLWVAVRTGHWGPTVQRSTDFGASWVRGEENPRYEKESGLSVKRVWHVEPGLEGELWAGVEPAGLFRSDDEGRTWQAIPGFNDRPDRKDWEPGGGGLCLHTILPYPGDPKRMLVGISAVGVLGTNDGGASWRVMNGAVRADFLPQKVTQEDEIGSCVHKVVRDPRDPAIVYQQNHCGVYRRARGDPAWTAVENGLPATFGFPMAAHPHDARTVYVVPLAADTNRVTPRGTMAVYRTTDGGERWEPRTEGFPPREAYLTVLREGLATDRNDPAGVYVGTKTGQLYFSRDEGDTWAMLREFLPPILSVEAGIAG